MDRPIEDAPPPPPEAVLIKVAREARGLSPERASEIASIRLGPARWRQIEAGYERKDPFKATRAPDKTLAHMARIVGVTPEQLEEANRAEAADILREILRQEALPAEQRPERPQLEAISGGAGTDTDDYEDESDETMIANFEAGIFRDPSERIMWALDLPIEPRLSAIRGKRRGQFESAQRGRQPQTERPREVNGR